MNISKHFLFLAAAVLVVFSGQSEAGMENQVNSPEFFARSLRMAMAESEQNRHFYETKSYIQQQSAQAAESEANNELLNGFLEVIDYVRLSAQSCYKGLKEANNSVATSGPEATIQIIDSNFDDGDLYIVQAGAKAYDTLGVVNQITDESTTHGIVESTEIVTRSGGVAFDGYDASRSLVTQGMRSGKDAPVQAILAAYRGVQSTEQAVYNMIKRFAKRAYDALLDEPLPLETTSQNSQMKNVAASQSPKCQNAIEHIEQSSMRASSKEGTSANKAKAIQVVRFGLVDSLKTIALAGQISYNAINEAKNNPNKEEALAIVNKGIADAESKCVTAVSIAQIALGGARHIIGKQIEQPIIQAMIIIEKSRVALLGGLNNSKLLLVQGIANDASEKAMQAGDDGTATSSYSAYAEVEKSADFAIDTIETS